MFRKTLLLAVFGVAVLAGPALAEEILYFTNGTTMPIVSHTLSDDAAMIEVVIGGGAFMAFPIDQIERIEDARGQVALLDGSGNKMVSTPTGAKYLTQGTVSPRHRRGAWGGDQSRSRSTGTDVEVDERGVAVIRPFANSSNPAKAKIGVSGRRDAYLQPIAESKGEGLIGSRRVGNKYVIPTNKGQASGKRVPPVGLSARSGSSSSRSSGDSGDSGEKK